jgi:superfamily II DNA/RNA helicase
MPTRRRHARRPTTTRRTPAAPSAASRRSRWDELPVQLVATEGLPSFRELGLPRGLANALARAGLTTPFPIQAATIPAALDGRDILGRAATGSGKTLAFGLPLIARLEGATALARRPRGLVLVPTRELAMQVVDALAPLGQARGVSVRLVAGGLPIHKQINALARGTDILVATPGRLVDLIDRGACHLDAVELTVLDEADHMADLGFLPVVRSLLEQTPAGSQRLLFSATLDGDVATLVDNYLTDPAVYALSAATAAVETMTHHVFRVRAEEKFDMTAAIASREGRSILFVRTKHGADRMAMALARVGVPAAALHGGLRQSQRNRALEGFRDGSHPVLVATDVAARGIHVDDVSLVLHVDPPQDAKDYLHRSGRTARAGDSGVVVLLVTPNDERNARRLLDDAGVRAEQHEVRVGDAVLGELVGACAPRGRKLPVDVALAGTAAVQSTRPHRPSRRTHSHHRTDSGATRATRATPSARTARTGSPGYRPVSSATTGASVRAQSARKTK